MMQSRFWALLSLSIAACASTEERIDISAEEAIMICRDNVRLNDLHKYRASATARRDEWVVLFESSSDFVGDFVYCHVSLGGKVRRIVGGN
jgi:hypothetical protein